MADFKDVYSLEFNASQFSAEVDAAIGKIEDLTAAIEDGADSADQLAAAQNDLTMVLGKEAKGVEQLNQKRTALVQTQGKLNKETKTGAAVTNELANTNKKLAVETGQAAGKQKSLISQLVGGARAINGVKRAAGLLTGAFRLLGAFNPLGMFLMVLPSVIGWFQKLTGTTDKHAEAMKKLDDASLTYGERITIIQDELERLNTLEAKRGYLTEEEKQQRDDLTKKYKETADEIVKIEEDRFNRQKELELQLQETRVKILGDTAAGAVASAELERKKLLLSLSKRRDQILDDSDKLFKELKQAQDEYNSTSSADANIRAIRIQNALDRNSQEELNLVEEQNLQLELIERSKNNKLQNIRDEANRKRLEEEKNLTDALAAEVKSRGDAIEAEFEFAQRTAEFEAEMAKKSLEATEAAKKADADALKALMAGYDAELKALQDSLNEGAQYRQNNREAELAMDLLMLEQERNQMLAAHVGDAKMQEDIDKEYTKRRLQIEKQANHEILAARIELLEKIRDTATDPLQLSELNKQISELKLKLTELGTATGETVEETKESWKKAIDTATQYIQLGSDTVFSVLNSQITAYISNLDKAADKSKSALDEIRANSEDFNARQLELEKERLEQIEAQREAAVEKEKRLAQIQLVINATLAIAKAAAEGGAAAPFTIAATIAALIAGFASARATATGAFFDGTEYLQRGDNPSGRDTIPIWANEGEAIIPTQTNSEYRNAVSAIYNKTIPADVLNEFASAYKQGGLQSALSALGGDVNLNTELGSKSVFVNVGNNFSGLESRLERIENALIELPKYMPRTTVTANANGIFKTVEARMARARFSKDRAK
jgi:hypothetical protein